MKMEFVKIGDEINAIAGTLRIVSRHGEDFCVEDFKDGVKVGERLLTRHDLNRIAKDADGKNHNFWWKD